MIAHDAAQGSPEWFLSRLGIPTASRFSELLTSQGKPSASQTGYMYELLAEQMAGTPEESFSNAWMERGNELEPMAREYYEIQTGLTVEQSGFVTTDDRSAGGSPDGLTPTGGIEIKCPKRANHIAYLLGGKCPAKYTQQVQGLMWIFERDHWDFVSYHPEMPAQLIVRVDRDDKWIGAFVDELYKFNDKLAKARQKLGLK